MVWLAWGPEGSLPEEELAEGLVWGRLVPIEPLPAQAEQDWMEAFASSLDDGWARDELREALGGRTPVRSFRAVLGRFPQERIRWLTCRVARIEALLRDWLQTNGIEPTTPQRRKGRIL